MTLPPLCSHSSKFEFETTMLPSPEIPAACRSVREPLTIEFVKSSVIEPAVMLP